MKIFSLFIAFTLICFALSQRAQGVVPPPPGGYANFTTAAGTAPFTLLPWALGTQPLVHFRCLASPLAASTPLLALDRLILIPQIPIRLLALQRFCLTPPAQKTRPMEQPRLNLTKAATDNTATGAFALFSNTTGINNTATGAGALFNNIDGIENTANGVNALRANTFGQDNTASGVGALLSNVTGNFNTANGALTLQSNSTGNNNTSVGVAALFANSAGDDNTAIGHQALFLNIVSSNTAVGAGAMANNTTGGTLRGSGDNEEGPNTALGASALNQNTVASSNTAVGFQALFATQSGGFSTAVGFKALANSTMQSNDAFGYKALGNNITGFGNVAVGDLALFNNTGGDNNVALGNRAGLNRRATITSISATSCRALPARAMPATSRVFSDKPRCRNRRFSLAATTSSVPPRPQSALKKILGQWIKPAKHSLSLNLSRSATRKTLIRQAHHSSDLWPKTLKK